MRQLLFIINFISNVQRSLALGIQWLVIRLLGTIPGPVAMGKLFDLACTRWVNNHILRIILRIILELFYLEFDDKRDPCV